MIPELGHYSLVLAGCLAVVASFSGLATARHPTYQRLVLSTTVGQCAFCVLAFVALVWSFAADDFSVAYVANHSNSLLPWYYKVSATWGGHEGSFLLWIAIMSAWMLALAIRSQNYPAPLVTRVLGVMALMNLGFICFALFTSNPFLRLIPMTPADGADLNPLLQDFGLIVHPPLLYAGYVGLAVPFAFAVAALLEGRVDAAWARWAKTWTNMAWALLTLGITLGSWWAYYELGWGGYWAWDPVENPPLITWLFATALVHSLAVTEKRGVFKSWTVLLAILAFSGSLLGTFITRSGLLTSVHAFAADPTRGIFILGILGLAVGGSLLLYAIRAPQLKTGFGFDLLSREMLLLANNVILVVASASVFLGTLFPMVYQAMTDDLISIGPPYFNAIFMPLMALLIVLLGIGPLTRWKKTSVSYLLAQLTKVAIASLVIGVVLPLIVIMEFSWVATAAVTLAAWISLSMAKDIQNKTANKPNLLAGLKSLSLSYYGMQAAHFGCVLMLIGVSLASAFSLEKSVLLDTGDSVDLGEYIFEFKGTESVSGPNYVAERAEIDVTRNGNAVETLHPERRIYLATGAPSTEMAIDAGFFRDLFVTLGEQRGESAWAMTIYVKPFIRWVWLGAIFMALGGCVAAGDKRYRKLRRKIEEPNQAKVEAQLQPGT